MANLSADFPQITSRMVNPDGTITEAWYLFLVQIFNRTGGTGGGGSALTPDEIIEAAFSQLPIDTPFVSPSAVLPEPTFTPWVADTFSDQSVTPPVNAPLALTEMSVAQPSTHGFMGDIVYPPQATELPSEVFSLSTPSSPRGVVAGRRQALSIDGGTVTGITLSRGSWTRNLAPSTQLIEMNTGDIVVVTYTAAPALTLLPR